MADYKTMYYQLAGNVADAIELLTQAQCKAEDTYLNSSEPKITLLQENQEKDRNGNHT